MTDWIDQLREIAPKVIEATAYTRDHFQSRPDKYVGRMNAAEYDAGIDAILERLAALLGAVTIVTDLAEARERYNADSYAMDVKYAAKTYDEAISAVAARAVEWRRDHAIKEALADVASMGLQPDAGECAPPADH